MKRVTLDRDLEAKVGSLHEEVEVCDEAGRTVGRFLPEGIYRRYLYEWANLQFDDEDLNRAARQPGKYTTAEVLDHLRSLDNSMQYTVIWSPDALETVNGGLAECDGSKCRDNRRRSDRPTSLE